MYDDIRHSRPLATAATLGEAAKDSSRFLDKYVLLTGDVVTLATKNGRVCLLSSLRLLIRVCRNVTVYLPPELSLLTAECKMVASRIAYDQHIQFADIAPVPAVFDAVLSVGTVARADLPWTVINSNGWLARVSSGSKNLNSDCSQPNPMGALAAASLGVTEVFKRLIQLRETRGKFFNGLTFSLYNYKTETDDPGPAISEALPSDVLIIGSGAIGNGIVYLLSELWVTGRVDIVDAQRFQPENLGTCILIGPDDIGQPKTAVAEAFLTAHGVAAKGYPEEDFISFRDRVGETLRYPKIVLNGLDNIETRHHVQDLWPDLVIDGAIGDFGCQVSVHPWDRNVACLRCLFKEEANEAAERIASRATGLTVTRVQNAEELLTEDDVKSAPTDKQTWLREQVGRKICSIVSEAIARELSIEKQRAGFRPSVPFVACLSASMVVGEFVKYQMGVGTSLEPRYQLDALWGPERGLEIAQERRRECICVTRTHNINLVRRNR